MKNFLHFAIGISLIISSAALLMFSIQPAYGEGERSIGNQAGSTPLNVLYINIDSINNNYLAYTDLAVSATNNLDSSMKAYQNAAADLQNRYAVLQQRVTIGSISAESAMKEEQAINDGLDKLRIHEAQLAVIESQAMAENDSISEIVALYFRKYAETHNVDYVLMYGTGMPIIYANQHLDVTDECVKELNAEYLVQHPDRIKAADKTGK